MNKKTLSLTLILFALLVVTMPLYVLAAGDKASEIANNIKNLSVTIGMAIVVIGWVIAGILYLTAAGAPEKINVAKQALVACIIGTALVAIAVAGYTVIEGIIKSAMNTGT